MPEVEHPQLVDNTASDGQRIGQREIPPGHSVHALDGQTRIDGYKPADPQAIEEDIPAV